MTDSEATLTAFFVVSLVVSAIACTSLYSKGVADGHEYERTAQTAALSQRQIYVDALEKRLAVLTNPPASATKAKILAEAP